jgi:hypothetical protein
MKRQMLLAITVVGTCIAILSARQTTRVGVISDAETGTPIAGATVRVSESGRATTLALVSTASREDGTSSCRWTASGVFWRSPLLAMRLSEFCGQPKSSPCNFG